MTAHSPESGEQCPACEGAGRVEIGRHVVSSDMASDAGDRSMAGMDFGPEYGRCHECGGSGQVGSAAQMNVAVVGDDAIRMEAIKKLAAAPNEEER